MYFLDELGKGQLLLNDFCASEEQVAGFLGFQVCNSTLFGVLRDTISVQEFEEHYEILSLEMMKEDQLTG